MAVDLSKLPPEILAQLPPAARAGIVDLKPAPGGGFYALGKDGGVFALGGAQFHGSVPGAGRMVGAASQLEIGPDGGYTVVGDQGHRYAFGTEYVSPQQKAEEAAIYKDPAYLAFLRGSDLTLEEAARQASRRQGAIESALALEIPDMEEARDEGVKGVGQSHEARGVFRSGQRLAQQQKEQKRHEALIAQRRGRAREQIAGEHETLAGKIAGVEREATEKGFGVAAEQDLAKRKEALRKKYPAQFGGQA